MELRPHPWGGVRERQSRANRSLPSEGAGFACRTAPRLTRAAARHPTANAIFRTTLVSATESGATGVRQARRGTARTSIADGWLLRTVIAAVTAIQNVVLRVDTRSVAAHTT